MPSYRPRTYTWISLLLALTLSATVSVAEGLRGLDRTAAAERQILLRTDAIDKVAARYGLEVLERHDTPEGPVFLVSVDAGQTSRTALPQITADAAVKSASGVSLASLPAITLSAAEATSDTADDLALAGTHSTPCLDHIDPDGVWRGFADQRAVVITRLHEGNEIDDHWCGYGITVAVIDTAVDTLHPVLQDALVSGYDFLAESAGLDSTQTSELDTKTRAIVEGDLDAVTAGAGSLNLLESAAVIMGEADEGVLDDLASKGPYYGHGTMVAGLVRLTAPAAKIMPLEVFDEEGVGHPLDVVRAIDHAVANGAHVINMSFSIPDDTPELQAAVERARQAGVMTIAAAGNHGLSSSIYPAAYGATIGVAATDFDDQLADFTNFGLVTADLAAPGAGVVTLYPGGLFATGWGTSFSTPMVSGVVAMIRTYRLGSSRGSHKQVRNDLLLGTEYFDYLWDYILSSGRLDTVGAVIQARY